MLLPLFLIALSSNPPTPDSAGVEALRRGRADLAAINVPTARSEFRRALEAGRAKRDSAVISAAYLGLASVARRSAGPVAAKPFLDSAFATAPDSASLALIWCDDAFGGVHTTTDPAALALRGVSIARGRGDSHLEGACRFAAGRVYWFQLRLDSTYSLLVAAADIGARTNDPEISGRAHELLGLGFRVLGQTERGLKMLRQAATESERAHDYRTLALVELNLGILENTLRDGAMAGFYARSAAGRFEKGGDVEGRETVRYLDVLLALDRRDFATARALCEAGLRWAARSGDGSAALDMHASLEHVNIAEHRWGDAERELDSIVAVYRRSFSGNWQAATQATRGALAAARGDAQGTIQWYSEFLRSTTRGQHIVRFRTREQLSLAYLRLGDTTRAESELVSATDELETYRDSLSDADLKLHAVETEASDGAPADAAERVIAAIVALGGRINVAFELVERRRARVALERIARVAVANTGGRTTALRRLPAPPTLDAFAAMIPDSRTAVLEYVAGAEGAPTSLLLITKSGARGYVLPRLDSIVEKLSGFETLVEAGAPSTTLARDLARTLLDPALADLPGTITRLLVIPDGSLHRLSFDALQLASGQRLVERYAVGVLPSAAIAAELWRRQRKAGLARVLAIGDPKFSSESEARDDMERFMRAGLAEGGGTSLPRLPGSGDEARSVSTFAKRSELRLRERASEAYFKTAPLDSFSVIHLATHALVDDASASRTVLALAPGGGEDGFLGLAELQSLATHADLVVLSACRTARGPIVGGEGVQGLAMPFIGAGARAVVATSWRIGDARVRRFIDDFYRALQRGDAVVDALRSAKLEAIRRGATPRDWAVFTVIGDPLTTVALDR